MLIVASKLKILSHILLHQPVYHYVVYIEQLENDVPQVL